MEHEKRDRQLENERRDRQAEKKDLEQKLLPGSEVAAVTHRVWIQELTNANVGNCCVVTCTFEHGSIENIEVFMLNEATHRIPQLSVSPHAKAAASLPQKRKRSATTA